MMIVRAVQPGDVDGLYRLANEASGGLTTLPPDRDILAERIDWSVRSFDAEIDCPGQEYYFLVLEDTEVGQIVGTSGIFAAVGLGRPFYTFKAVPITKQTAEPDITVNTAVLILSQCFRGATEIATLYLDPPYRAGGNGSLLSKARYLLIGGYPDRFAEVAMAEVRGWVDDEGHSPFWDAVGGRFIPLSLVEADRVNSLGNHQFIKDLMPEHPIFINMLPKEVQDVIGVPHPESLAALKILEKEGFYLDGAFDIFDAGPSVQARTADIRSVRRTTRYGIGDVGEPVGGAPALIANPALDEFRVVRATAQIVDGQAVIARETADALNVDAGGSVLIAAETGSG